MLRPGKDKGLATPIPLGLAGLATTALILGIGAIFQRQASFGPYFLQALMFGGLVELMAGMWAFAYGDALAATTFSFLGAFYGWYALAHMTFLGAVAADTMASNSMSLVLIVSAVVVLYLWLASFYEFAAFNLVLLFLWISYGLAGIATFTAMAGLAMLGGLAAIVSGLIAAYASFAGIYNEVRMQEVVPVGESKTVRERAEHEEMERIRRIHSADSMRHEAGAHA
jgi:uncharacterized protein